LEETDGQNITEHNDMRVYSTFKQDVLHCGREQYVFRCQHLYSYYETLILSSIIGISYDIQVKGKGNPVTGPGGPIGRVEV
jgi:hypothetical protein